MKIAILHGGTSTESGVSTRNALCMEKALRTRGHDAELVAYAPPALERLTAFSPDVVFIAVQGPGHGDGVAQAVCEFLTLPHTGTRHVDAAVINNKALCKTLAAHHGIPTPSFTTLRKKDWEAGDKAALLKRHCERLGLPLVAKIVDQGGSFGLTYLENEKETDRIDAVFRYGNELLFEQFVPGRFFTVGVLETDAATVILPPVTARATSDHADPLQLFNRPYAVEPFVLPGQIRDRVAERTLRLYSLFNCRGYARVDYMMGDRDDGEFQFIEINAVPGLNEKSLYPYAASLEGIGMADICESIVQNGIAYSPDERRAQ